ncbi:MAG: cupin domain-containing protein, partial [Pseudomonadota bacterium]
PAFVLLVQTQAALRDDVMESVVFSETVASAFLEHEAPAALSEGAVDQALARINALDFSETSNETAARIASEIVADLQVLPDPLLDQATATIEAGGGWKFAGPGIKRMKLDLQSDADAEIYRIDPGAKVPTHTHEAYEFTLCLAGGFSDASGSYGPGDLSVKGPDDTHAPMADPGEPCFTLAVRGGGLRFKGMYGLVQRMIGG